SIRVYYGKQHGLRGRCRMNFNWWPINTESVVLISAAEATDPIPGTGFTLPTTFTFLLGDADVSVTNVSPHVGGVEFILHVNWDEPLNIVVDITVFDPGEQFWAV
ncbi:MAG: hypothetical protein ACREMQ_00460, partial [Longimicrobiales bacterium]